MRKELRLAVNDVWSLTRMVLFTILVLAVFSGCRKTPIDPDKPFKLPDRSEKV